MPPPLPTLDDDRLAELAAGGDRQALARLAERHAPDLLAYCRRIVRSDADAQDAVQATLLSALVGLPRRAHAGPVRPWLYRVAHNHCVDLLRRRGRIDGEPAADTVADLHSVHDVVVGRQAMAELVDDLRALPDRQRDALVLREFGRLPYATVAEAVGTNPVAARKLVNKARTNLREARAGRAIACAEIRMIADDGDRRRLRARAVAAHLRVCADCAVRVRASRRPRAAALLGWWPFGGGSLLGGGGGAAGVGIAAKPLATVAACCLLVTPALERRAERALRPPTAVAERSVVAAASSAPARVEVAAHETHRGDSRPGAATAGQRSVGAALKHPTTTGRRADGTLVPWDRLGHEVQGRLRARIAARCLELPPAETRECYLAVRSGKAAPRPAAGAAPAERRAEAAAPPTTTATPAPTTVAPAPAAPAPAAPAPPAPAPAPAPAPPPETPALTPPNPDAAAPPPATGPQPPGPTAVPAPQPDAAST